MILGLTMVEVIDMRLKGRVAIVTGAGRGIGNAIARLYAQEGARVVINYSKSEREASSLAEEIKKNGGDAILVRADISKITDIKQMIHSTIEHFGRVDVLVNNAGILGAGSFLDITEETLDRTIEVNLKGPYLCSKEVAPVMLRQGKGKIINISSISGLAERTSLTNTPYVVSKAGLIGLTRSLAVNLGPTINVNAICPGSTETEMIASYGPEGRARRLRETILGRFAKPEEIAAAALFLASDESNFITGEILTVGGGRGMR